MPRPSLADSFVAFRGGLALYAGDGVDLTQPLDVEIGLTGQYKTRNFELTTKTFEQMIANHAGAGVDPAVDREHESWFSFEATPALGWVKALDIKPATVDKRRSALVGRVQLNDIGQEAVRDGHYRYVSMGFDKAGKNRQTGEPIGAVLDHLALVKNPFIQGMRPLSLALSTRLGRLVEEESPMEQLAQKLRESLGLSAGATEEQIIAAYAAAAGKQAAAANDREALSRSLDEQKRISARLEAEVERLSKDGESRDAREWASTVDQALKDFRLTPAEAEEHKALTGAERALAGRLLAKRVPNKPAGEDVKTLATPHGDKATAALKAIDEYLKANPKATTEDAYAACAAANPELFREEA